MSRAQDEDNAPEDEDLEKIGLKVQLLESKLEVLRLWREKNAPLPAEIAADCDRIEASVAAARAEFDARTAAHRRRLN